MKNLSNKITRKSFKKGDEGWKEIRKTFVTGTEMSLILGLNPYPPSCSLWENKHTSNFISNDFMESGQLMEPAVANFASDALGGRVKFFFDDSDDRGDVVFFREDAKIGVTPDAFIKILDNNITPVELKCTSEKNIKSWALGEENYPVHYLIQLAVQLYILNSNVGYLFGLGVSWPKMPRVLFKLRYDNELSEIFENEARRFFDEKENFKINRDVSEKVLKILYNNITLVKKINISEVNRVKKIKSTVEKMEEFTW